MGDWKRDIDLGELQALLTEVGVPALVVPPISDDTYEDIFLVQWWENHQGKMTEEQKAALWRFLEIPPFRIDAVPIDAPPTE